MSKYLLPLLSLLTIALMGCREDVELTTKYVETPVIFALLDQGEDQHFIKINRGFIGPGNALEFAKIPDSNYFENVSGKVEEIINNVVVRSWFLKDTLVNTKSTDGIFFGPQQKVYFFDKTTVLTGIADDPLSEDANFKLTVDINEGKLQVVGETRLVKGFAEINKVSAQTFALKLVKTPADYQSVIITCSQGNAVFGNITFELDIAEIRGTDTSRISIPWNIGEAPISGSTFTLSSQGETFYNAIKNGITNDNTITKRNFMGYNAKFVGGSNEFYNYILVNQPSSSLTQTKPVYTNLSVTAGHKVVGLFSARQTVNIYKPFMVSAAQAYIRAIDKQSTRELCEGTILATYKFCSQHVADLTENYSCP